MFLPFEIVVIAILSPFFVLLWVIAFIVKLVLKFAWFIFVRLLKLSLKMIKWLVVAGVAVLLRWWHNRRNAIQP